MDLCAELSITEQDLQSTGTQYRFLFGEMKTHHGISIIKLILNPSSLDDHEPLRQVLYRPDADDVSSNYTAYMSLSS